ncbi:MAG: hypothetical protein H6550_06885 [Chitinophagales bacterium]|nr:hypothetical protein [Chitinophagales bacterium]
MLDQLMQIVQQNAQSSIVENDNVPNQYNEAVMQEAGTSIFSGLQNMMNSGNMDQVSSLFSNGNNAGDSNIVNQLSGNFIDSITQKFGIDKGAASGIAASLIPQVINSLTKKANDPNDNSIGLSGILSSLQGNGGISNTINSVGGMLGLDKDKDGDVDLNDITKMFS